jgi:hypothetical protein
LDNFVTLKTFTYPYELAILRGRLEYEGIECFVKDEFSVQVNPFYSNAIDGVKLQVKQSDIENAIKILKANGYTVDEDVQPYKLYGKLDNVTSKFPLIKNLRLEFRLMIIIAIIVGFLAYLFFLLTTPSTIENLTEKTWCVDKIVYHGKDYYPNSNELFQIHLIGMCDETASFTYKGPLILPGFNSHKVHSNWYVRADSLNIAEADTFAFVYNGIYHVDFTSNKLELKSASTTIYCHNEHFSIHIGGWMSN